MKRLVFLLSLLILWTLPAQKSKRPPLRGSVGYYSDYLLGPNHFAYPVGHGQFKIAEIFLAGAELGLSENLSLGLYTSPAIIVLGGVFGTLAVPVLVHGHFVTPIFSKYVHGGVGAYYLVIFTSNEPPFHFAAPYGGLTIGTPDNNLTVNVFVLKGESTEKITFNTFHVGGKVKLSRRYHFIGEFFTLPADDPGTGELIRIPVFLGGLNTKWRWIALDLGAGLFPPHYLPYPYVGVRFPL